MGSFAQPYQFHGFARCVNTTFMGSVSSLNVIWTMACCCHPMILVRRWCDPMEDVYRTVKVQILLNSQKSPCEK
jgi:hypothetical protein